MVKKILVTGGAGFIGSNFVHYALERHPDWEVTNLDKLTYAGNLENLSDLEGNGRYHFQRGDIRDNKLVDKLVGQGFEVIINFAAESHVDRSILDPSPFLQTNIGGTQVLLEAARKHKVTRFIQISTDEVYGSLGPEGKFTESSPISPNSPYAASKAAADLMCAAYSHTYELPVIITRCSNNYGPFQFPEKLIPLVIANALEDKPVPVYGDGLNVRDWIHVVDHCSAIDAVVREGKVGEVYNISADSERTNLELVRQLLHLLGKPESLITFVADRPGHDRRYALDSSKLRSAIGWQSSFDLERGLEQTVDWYVKNRQWWEKLKKRARTIADQYLASGNKE